LEGGETYDSGDCPSTSGMPAASVGESVFSRD
jgi:hypothetical protein